MKLIFAFAALIAALLSGAWGATAQPGDSTAWIGWGMGVIFLIVAARLAAQWWEGRDQGAGWKASPTRYLPPEGEIGGRGGPAGTPSPTKGPGPVSAPEVDRLISDLTKRK